MNYSRFLIRSLNRINRQTDSRPLNRPTYRFSFFLFSLSLSLSPFSFSSTPFLVLTFLSLSCEYAGQIKIAESAVSCGWSRCATIARFWIVLCTMLGSVLRFPLFRHLVFFSSLAFFFLFRLASSSSSFLFIHAAGRRMMPRGRSLIHREMIDRSLEVSTVTTSCVYKISRWSR